MKEKKRLNCADLSRSEVGPEDILSGAATISKKVAFYSRWLDNQWAAPDDYLKEAKEGFSKTTAFGFDVAVTYAKRSVCCRIDRLILYNHLTPFYNMSYPEKFKMLTQIGLPDVSIVQELIIDLRNLAEHSYSIPTEANAKKAIQLAELFLLATRDHEMRSGIVALGGYTYDDTTGQGFTASISPLLFVDVADEGAVFIVIPKDKEAIFTKLANFKKEHSIALANLLQEHYNENGTSRITNKRILSLQEVIDYTYTHLYG